jgi:hypothetical protein
MLDVVADLAALVARTCPSAGLAKYFFGISEKSPWLVSSLSGSGPRLLCRGGGRRRGNHKGAYFIG